MAERQCQVRDNSPFSEWWTFSDGMVSSDRDDAGVYEFANSSGTIV